MDSDHHIMAYNWAEKLFHHARHGWGWRPACPMGIRPCEKSARHTSHRLQQGSYRAALCLVLLGLLVCIAPSQAQVGAKLAPADAGVMIQVDDLAKLRADWEKDPLVKMVLERTGIANGNEGWDLIKTVMGMDTGQILDTYFGKRIVLIAEEEGDGKPGVILSEVTPQHAQLAIERLGLIPQGKAGDFELFTTADDKGQFAFSDGWMAMCDIAHLDYMTQVLERDPQAPSLADQAEYKALVSKLPKQHSALVFVRKPAEQEVHALSLQTRERSITVHYAGQPGAKGRDFLQLNHTGTVTTGPLPASTLGVMAMNLFTADMPLENERMLDRLIAPRTVRKDVLPKLAGPVLLALAEEKPSADQPQNANGRPQAVLALAIELVDASVATDFKRLLDGALLLLNLQSAQWGTEPVAMNDQTYAGAAFRVADVGPMLADRAQRPELENMQLVYGQVGSWFMLTTSRAYFEKCLDAAAEPTQRFKPGTNLLTLIDDSAIKAAPLGLMTLQPQPLAAHLQQWIKFWEKERPQLLAAARQQPQSPEGKFAQAVLLSEEVLRQLKNLDMQLHKLDEQTLGATLTITR